MTWRPLRARPAIYIIEWNMPDGWHRDCMVYETLAEARWCTRDRQMKNDRLGHRIIRYQRTTWVRRGGPGT